MSAPIKTIHVKPGSELDRLLEDAEDAPIELEKNGVRHGMNRVDPLFESNELATDAPHYDSILNIIGIGTSEEETNVGRYKREYVAEAIESWHEDARG